MLHVDYFTVTSTPSSTQLVLFAAFPGSLLDFVKEGDGKFLTLITLVDMAAKVNKKTYISPFK